MKKFKNKKVIIISSIILFISLLVGIFAIYVSDYYHADTISIKMYIEDHLGTMAAPYNMDYGIHVNEEGCIEWMQALLSYAYIEMMGENK